VVPVIRKLHPTRIILLQGLKYGNPAWIVQNPTALWVPPGDAQLMLEIHNYDPFPYAGANPSLHSWGSAADKAALKAWAGDIQTWAAAHELPIYYGEFGCTNAQTAATGRDLWFQAHATTISEHGWAAAVWSDGNKHLIYNYEDGSWVADILADLGHPLAPTPAPAPPPPTPAGFCNECGYGCDENCICGRCNTKPGCENEKSCLGPCNGGGNAKWCGGGAPPTPPSPGPPPTPAGFCNECGYDCDENCICGRCNTKPGCESEASCLGPCNGGGNAKWCGGGGTPTPVPPPPAPTPAGACPGGSLSACMALCPATPAAAYKACVDTCVAKCT
jgi:hypothetical protein